MDLIKFLFNFSLFLSTVQSFPVFELVKDFITLHQEPLRLSAFVCWKKQDILSFIKFMNENSIMVVYSTAITLLDDPEHQLYFIDLDCEKSEDILFQVNRVEIFIYNIFSIYYLLYSVCLKLYSELLRLF